MFARFDRRLGPKIVDFAHFGIIIGDPIVDTVEGIGCRRSNSTTLGHSRNTDCIGLGPHMTAIWNSESAR